VDALAETPRPSTATSGAAEARPSPLTIRPCGSELLAELADARECVAADGSDEVEGADCSGEADESEPQAASRTRAKSAPAIRRTPIPFFMMITSFLLRSVSDASLKAGKSPEDDKNAYAGAQANL